MNMQVAIVLKPDLSLLCLYYSQRKRKLGLLNRSIIALPDLLEPVCCQICGGGGKQMQCYQHKSDFILHFFAQAIQRLPSVAIFGLAGYEAQLLLYLTNINLRIIKKKAFKPQLLHITNEYGLYFLTEI